MTAILVSLLNSNVKKCFLNFVGVLNVLSLSFRRRIYGPWNYAKGSIDGEKTSNSLFVKKKRKFLFWLMYVLSRLGWLMCMHIFVLYFFSSKKKKKNQPEVFKILNPNTVSDCVLWVHASQVPQQPCVFQGTFATTNDPLQRLTFLFFFPISDPTFKIYFERTFLHPSQNE